MSKLTQDIITGYTVVSGLLLLTVGSTERVVASLTQQGIMVGMAPVQSAMLKPAAWQQDTVQTIGPDVAMGMLLVLLGLATHVFFVLRRKKPTTV